MSVYGNSLKNNDNVNEGIVAASILAFYPAISKIFKIINLTSITIYSAIFIKDTSLVLEKLKVIEDWYLRNDPLFIKFGDLKKKTYSCKRFYDNQYELGEEINSLSKLVKSRYYPDKAQVYYKDDNNIVCTYYECYNIGPDIDVRGGFKIIDSSQTQEESAIYEEIDFKDPENVKLKFNPLTMDKAKLKKVENKVFFQINNPKLEKYKYYYLTRISIANFKISVEARNWVDREYKTIKEKKEKEQK